VQKIVNSHEANDTHFALQQRLILNTQKFAAAKAYAATQELKEHVSNGDLNAIKATVNKYNRFQAAEYQATLNRSRTARQWNDYTGDADRNKLFPNMKWLPSRSVNPRPEHEVFWNLVLPKTNSFWSKNQPGNVWGCKCDWIETDEGSTQQPARQTPAAKGLQGNPAETGKVFSNDASYFRPGAAAIDQAILTLPPDSTYFDVSKNIRCNIMRDGHKDKFVKELNIAADMERQGYKIDMLPEIHANNAAERAKFLPEGYIQRNINKNPDAVITKNAKKMVADFKEITGWRNLVKRINESNEQADYVVIKMSYDNQQPVDKIKERVDDALSTSTNIKGVIVLDRKGDVFYKSF
jgi:hypothetical protein